MSAGEIRYTRQMYKEYREWFLQEYTSKDPALQPSSYDQWVDFNKAFDAQPVVHFKIENE